MGLLDDVDEDKIATGVMEELGFDNNEPVIQEPEVQPVQEPVYYEEPVAEEVAEETTDEQIETQLSEVERRLAKAQLYKQLIVGTLFNGEGDVVQEVEKEFHDYARQQLQILMGLQPQKEEKPEPGPLFTEEEVTILRKFIESIKGRVLEKVTKPTAQPTVTKPIVTTKPVAKPTAKPAPTVKPAPKPAPKKPQLKIREVPEEVPTTKTTKPKPPSKPLPPIPPRKQPAALSVPEDESVVEENGQRYKIRHVGMPNIDEFGIMDGTKIRKLPAGGTCMLSNGIQVVKNELGVCKVLRTLLTANTEIPGRAPFPSREQMSTITAQQAENQALSCLPPSLGAILGKK